MIVLSEFDFSSFRFSVFLVSFSLALFSFCYSCPDLVTTEHLTTLLTGEAFAEYFLIFLLCCVTFVQFLFFGFGIASVLYILQRFIARLVFSFRIRKGLCLYKGSSNEG